MELPPLGEEHSCTDKSGTMRTGEEGEKQSNPACPRGPGASDHHFKPSNKAHKRVDQGTGMNV